MEYTGLLHKYPVNRPLTENEHQDQLKQGQRCEGELAYQLSAIRMNSTFIELVDKFYGWKGVLTTACILAGILFAVMVARSVWLQMTFYLSGRDSANDVLIQIVLLLVVFALAALFPIWLLRKEAFAYTHYPIRLNRKTRMVHVFRLDGTVLSVPWNEVFFCLSYCKQGIWDIRGHVLEKDGMTVKETFSFGVIGSGETGKKVLREYWEFVRRYMEEGPAEAARLVTIFLPIAEKRERVIDGFRRMHAEASGAPALLRLLAVTMGLIFIPGRWFAMRTSKVPRWPSEIEAVCRVELNDPCDKDARSNPSDLQQLRRGLALLDAGFGERFSEALVGCPVSESLTSIVGVVSDLVVHLGEEDFVRNEAQKITGVAAAAGLAASELAGAAAGASISAASAGDSVEFFSCKLGTQRVEGRFSKVSFKTGDHMSFVVNENAGRCIALAARRPSDHVLWMIPHGSRGARAHSIFSWRLLCWLLAVFLLAGALFIVIMEYATSGSLTFDWFAMQIICVVAVIFAPYFAFRFYRQWLPIAQQAERICAALGYPDPSGVDLPRDHRDYCKAHGIKWPYLTDGPWIYRYIDRR